MMNPRSIGASLDPKLALAANVVAGGGADGVEANGYVIDREDAHSAAVVLGGQATLGASETAQFQLTIQHGDESDGSDMADAPAAVQPGGAAASVVLTLTDAVANERGEYKLDLDFSLLKRYVRVQVEVTMSAGTTDTVAYAAFLVLGGLVVAPQGAN